MNKIYEDIIDDILEDIMNEISQEVYQNTISERNKYLDKILNNSLEIIKEKYILNDTQKKYLKVVIDYDLVQTKKFIDECISNKNISEKDSKFILEIKEALYFMKNIMPTAHNHICPELECINLKISEEKPNIFNSKLGGMPYLPLTMEYPKSEYDNLPLRFLSQINFEEMPYLFNFPEKGILQFFIKNNHTYGDNSHEYGYKKDDIKVIYHKDIIKDENLLYKDLSSFEIDKIYEEDENFFVFDLNYEKKLIGNLEISHINETCENELEIIDDLVEDFINKNNITIYTDDCEELIDNIKHLYSNYDDNISIQIDGKPLFPQGEDYRTIGMTLLFQVKFSQIFPCDISSYGLFIEEDDLKNLDFSNVICNIDCC